MFFKKKKEADFVAIMSGTLMSLDQVEDQVFSTRMMGDGYAITPTQGTVYSPCSGEITVVFPTHHAYGISTSDGKEILIHLGIDTVELQGKGFETLVRVGDKVKTGQLIAKMDLPYIKTHGKSTCSMVIFTSKENIKLLKENQPVNALEEDIFEFIK